MKAIVFDEPGGPEVLYLGDLPDPAPGPQDLLVRVAATSINRADTLQRRGKYPVPVGDSPILGLEMAGTVIGMGAEVKGFEVGDNICGLLNGGGYAQLATIHQDMALRLPGNLSFTKAAAIPEVFLTAYQALHWLGHTQPGETVLIHAGASGVGTAAIQLARLIGTRIIITASAGKHDTCRQLGAEYTIDYENEDFAERVLEITGGRGANVVIDFIGGPYFQANLDCMAMEGRLVMLSFLGGVQTNSFNLAPILRKRLQIVGSTLRARSLDYKRRLTDDFQRQYWSAFADRQLHSVVDSIYDWEDVAAAHRYMEANRNQGKIVLTIGDEDLQVGR